MKWILPLIITASLLADTLVVYDYMNGTTTTLEVSKTSEYTADIYNVDTGDFYTVEDEFPALDEDIASDRETLFTPLD